MTAALNDRRMLRGARPTPRHRDPGQAVVEFAIALPLVVMVLLGVVQLLVVARAQIAIELAARDGARSAAVAAAPHRAAATAANAATSLRPISVSASVDGDHISVTVEYTTRTEIPVIGPMIGPIELAATVTMHREPP